MKHLLELGSGSTRQPHTNTSFEHLQEAYQEAIDALARGLIGDDSLFTILYGCAQQQSGSDWWISAGAIWYDGEIYLCDAISSGSPITVSGFNIPIGTITTVYHANDPITFTDGTTDNVHQIKKIVWSSGTTGSADVDFEDCVRLRDQGEWTDILPSTFKVRYNSSGTQVWEASTSRSFDGASYMKACKFGKRVHIDFNLVMDFNSGSPNNLALDMSGMGFDIPSWITPAATHALDRICSVENTAGTTYSSPEGAQKFRIYTGDPTTNAPDFQLIGEGFKLNGGTVGHTANMTTLYYNFDYSSSATGTRLTSGSVAFTLTVRGEMTYEASDYEQPQP